MPAVMVHVSHAYKNMDMARERISLILELMAMFLSFQGTVVLFPGFPTRMVYLYYMSCLRYTILVENPRNFPGLDGFALSALSSSIKKTLMNELLEHTFPFSFSFSVMS